MPSISTRAATAQCDSLYFDQLNTDVYRWCVPGVSWQHAVYTHWCDGRTPVFKWWESMCGNAQVWESVRRDNPGLFDAELECSYTKNVNGQPPPEVCGNGIDEDCDGIAAACSGCVSGQTAYCAGFLSSTYPYAIRNTGQCRDGVTTCGTSGAWSACVGAVTPSPEDADAVDNDCDGVIDEGSTMPNAPPASACFEPPASDDLLQVNQGCSNGDYAGYDPILLATRSAVTEPFTDFQVTVLRTLGITRSYSSGDVMTGGAAGIFGLGWHHGWETVLRCGDNGASCDVQGLGGTMRFAAQASTVAGVGALQGETLVLYRRTEPENLATGGHNLMVRRPSGEFILFRLDGSELHFVEPSSCFGTFCMDPNFNGTLRLSRDVDAAGRGVGVDFTVPGRLLSLTDDLGNRLSLESGSCPSRAGTLYYRVGPSGTESAYVTYEYSNCETLARVVPSNVTPAPGKNAQLRRYEYVSATAVGLLTHVRNEFDNAIAVFGYDASGRATSLLEGTSSLTIEYPQVNRDVVTSSYGALQAKTTTFRDSSGKTLTAENVPGFTRDNWDELWDTSTDKMTWSGRYLTCSEQLGHYLRHFKRDQHNRAETISDYGAAGDAHTETVHCKDSPWDSKAPLRSTRFEYSVTKAIASGVSLSLELVTKTSRTSVFGTQLANAQGGSANASNYRAAESLDYDNVAKAGDPSGYTCGPPTLPAGAVVCRRFVEGFTKNANGTIVQRKLATFYSYDASGRLVRTYGPIYVLGTPPAGNVNPVEVRTYWPDTDTDPLKRGRLHEVKRWPGGYPAEGSALVTTILLYDAFGPTQVQDEAGGITIYSRAGGAGRVTRVDNPDGSYVSTRYYDLEKPRLVLTSGGSVWRFTYDSLGRLRYTQPISSDPDKGYAAVGWTETRDYDAAGNVTLLTRKDATGVVRWKQAFEHYPNGELRKLPHPEIADSFARWTRDPVGVAAFHLDEDKHWTSTSTDALKRVTKVAFGYRDANGTTGIPFQGFAYEYEPGQDRLSKVSSLTSTTATPGSTYPVIASYVHDDFGHLLSVSSPYTMTAGPYVYAYDGRGNVVERTGGGAVLSWQYDGLNRVKSQTATRNSDQSTLTYTYTYDDPTARGRLRSIIEPDRTTTFTFDEMGWTRFEEVAEAGVATRLTTEYVYDADGYLSEVKSPLGLHVKYERDKVTKDIIEVRNVSTGTKYASNVKHLPSGPITDLTFAGGATLSQGFNLRYEPMAISSGALASTATALQLNYTLSVSGSGLIKDLGSMSFTYDKRDRLESATPLLTTPYTYVYPNDTTAWLAVNDRPQEAQDATGRRAYAFGYDDGSSLSAISKYDATGATISSTTCLVHDALGRLTAVGPAKVLTRRSPCHSSAP